MRYSDEEKRRILEESRCLLAELDAKVAYELAGADVIETTHALDYVPAPQDPLTRWREEQLELEARRKRARQMEADDQRAADPRLGAMG